MRVLNTTQMREADRRTIEDLGIPSIVLMENAGHQVVAAIDAACGAWLAGRVAVFCGRGNNGGDGLVVARLLHERGVDVGVYLVGRCADLRGDARANLEAVLTLGITVVEIAVEIVVETAVEIAVERPVETAGDVAVDVTSEDGWTAHARDLAACTLIVDALVGTGARVPLDGLLATIVEGLNALAVPIVSVDLPSGLSADTADVQGAVIEAAMTVALGALKVPLILPPGDGYAGEVVVADIGIPDDVIETIDGPHLALLTPEALAAFTAPRPAESHKGSFGRVTVVAGSPGKTGAAALTALGALRSGAGLVTVATPAACLPIVAALAPEYMTHPLPEADDGGVAASAIDAVLAQVHDVIACGPGLGRTADVAAFVRALLDRATVPLVLDADALTVLGSTVLDNTVLNTALKSAALRGSEERPVVITPHPGEMARLIGRSVEDVQRNRLAVARAVAADHRVFVVLKGHRTIVATPEGRTFINPTGNPGMATGGTGDVLAGAVAAWLAQGLDPEDACCLAVFLHGCAGDLAADAEGEVAMTAGDVVKQLGAAWKRLAARFGGEATFASEGRF